MIAEMISGYGKSYFDIICVFKWMGKKYQLFLGENIVWQRISNVPGRVGVKQVASRQIP